MIESPNQFHISSKTQQLTKHRSSKYKDDSMMQGDRLSGGSKVKVLTRDVSVVKEEKLKRLNYRKRKSKEQVLEELRSSIFIIKEKTSPKNGKDQDERTPVARRRPSDKIHAHKKSSSDRMEEHWNTNLSIIKQSQKRESPENYWISTKSNSLNIAEKESSSATDKKSDIKLPMFNFSERKQNKQGVAQRRNFTSKFSKFNLNLKGKISLPKNSQKSSLLERRKNFKNELNIVTKKKETSKNELEKIRYKHSFYAANRPIIWQQKAALTLLENLLKLKTPSKFKTILLNVSSAKVISHLREYNRVKRSKKIHISVTTPHLMFYSDKIQDRMTQFKFGQPIGDRVNRKHLINHFQISSFELIGSGHIYVPKIFKTIDNGCFFKSVNGKSSFPGCLLVKFCNSNIDFFQDFVQQDSICRSSGPTQYCSKLRSCS